MTMRGKEYLCAIRPCGDGLLLETLHYADEIKNADPLFSTIEDDAAEEDLLAVATELIDRKSAPFDAAAFEDRYDIALRELLESKRRNKKTPRAKTGAETSSSSGGENVVDLMAALKESLKADKGSGGKSKARTKKSTAKKSGATKKSA